MGFPKPGLEYRYKFKLPNHLERKQQRRARDHTKIYELLSDKDLGDIRGAGLAKLDEEEAARFEKEKEIDAQNDEGRNEKNKTDPLRPKKKARSTLIGGLKNPPLPAAKSVVHTKKGGFKEDKANATPIVKQDKVVAANVKVGKAKGSNRGKKRKAAENEKVDVSAAIPEDAKNDDSSKENDAVSGAKLSLLSNRNKEQPAQLENSDPQLKTWRVCNDSETAPPLPLEGKKSIQQAKRTKASNEVTQVDNGSLKIRLSALNAYATWFVTQNTDKKSKKTKPKKIPEPSGSSCIKQKKQLKQCKKRAPSNLAPKKVSTKGKKQLVCKPQPELTTKQITRRIRYTMEKHFALMPGMKYRCPKMTDKAVHYRGTGHLRKKFWICLVCHQEELNDKGDIMVCCERCDDWYHLPCVGVPDESYPVYLKWYCKRCMSREIKTGSFDPDKWPLYNNMKID